MDKVFMQRTMMPDEPGMVKLKRTQDVIYFGFGNGNQLSIPFLAAAWEPDNTITVTMQIIPPNPNAPVPPDLAGVIRMLFNFGEHEPVSGKFTIPIGDERHMTPADLRLKLSERGFRNIT